ncbi:MULTISPECIES: glutamate--tRNA ligase family protein [unclassified Campylobacter]|uniref:glutamate--tRNA ligase family protein n=1 Tax=unclassified Campylobacter TaxID=2593542 RepID=UPI003D3305CE
MIKQNSKIISRIAPTPSGYLHAGNALNFILTYLYTKAQNGILHLRIDDYDTQRCKDEYIQNIFDTLEFLGINYDFGAKSVSEFWQKFSFTHRMQSYKTALKSLNHETYACQCSRNTANAYKNGIYTKICKDKNLSFTKDKTAIRICTDKTSKLGAVVASQMGDLILWKKDDTPSYNFASVIDDELLGVNLLVRGADLKKCSNAQLYIAKRLNLAFENANFIHHELIIQNGKKLSKSHAAPAINLCQKPQLYYLLTAKSLGLKQTCANSLENLLNEFIINFNLL